MRTRVIRQYDARKFRDVLLVQQWYTAVMINQVLDRELRPVIGGNLKMVPHRQAVSEDEHWEPIETFELYEYDKATAFAMDLSMTEKSVTELAVFENGKAPIFDHPEIQP